MKKITFLFVFAAIGLATLSSCQDQQTCIECSAPGVATVEYCVGDPGFSTQADLDQMKATYPPGSCN